MAALLCYKKLLASNQTSCITLGSDIGTRRRGAGDFVRALCRRFESQVTAILSTVISLYLNECALNLHANWLKKDVIYCLVTAMASKSETLRFGATSTSELVSSSVF